LSSVFVKVVIDSRVLMLKWLLLKSIFVKKIFHKSIRFRNFLIFENFSFFLDAHVTFVHRLRAYFHTFLKRKDDIIKICKIFSKFVKYSQKWLLLYVNYHLFRFIFKHNLSYFNDSFKYFYNFLHTFSWSSSTNDIICP